MVRKTSPLDAANVLLKVIVGTRISELVGKPVGVMAGEEKNPLGNTPARISTTGRVVPLIVKNEPSDNITVLLLKTGLAPVIRSVPLKVTLPPARICNEVVV